jgi:rubrerythrin
MEVQEIKFLKIFKDNINSSLKKEEKSMHEHIALLSHDLISHVNKEKRLALLKNTLQQAIELEFGTIPIYLSALWSIKDNQDPISKSIRNVVQEEMLHLALACNMLTAIGGEPIIYDTSSKGLQYPTKLPGGVHPELTLKLSGLTDDILDDFLEIELPQGEIMIEHFESKYKDAHNDEEHSTTIGALYTAINKEFHSLNPPMLPDKQISGPLAWFVVDNLEKIDSAIEWIKEQGEGAVEKTEEDIKIDELSHFYRFWEIRKRKKIEKDPITGKYSFKSELKFPEVWPMAVVPEGGYQKGEVSDEVWELTHQFDLTYSKMIHTLESAWGDGGQAALWRAIDMMFDLEKFALPLMKMAIPGQSGNYGPSFRLIKY